MLVVSYMKQHPLRIELTRQLHDYNDNTRVYLVDQDRAVSVAVTYQTSQNGMDLSFSETALTDGPRSRIWILGEC